MARGEPEYPYVVRLYCRKRSERPKTIFDKLDKLSIGEVVSRISYETTLINQGF